MEELSDIARGGIGAAFAMAVAIAWVLVREFLRRRERREKERDDVTEQLKDAQARWSAALFCGDAAAVAREKRRMDRLLKLRESLGVAVAALCALCLAGCRAAPPRVVLLSEHCRTVSPGDTVPDLPAGEPLFWLCTPTGLEMMLPAGSTIPEVPK